ncbi:MAG TPA: hypothetical protein VL443_14865 [Cyclobacteriaceae bacterium]|jgi:hypothetical protein|nr:hypothetical protein [Cyclobacteriaceae bacterium]
MEKNKTSKRALRGLINDSVNEALGKLELPKASKKVKKAISKNSKKLATMFADIIKRETKKKARTEKTLTYVEDVLKGKKKDKKKKAVKAES